MSLVFLCTVVCGRGGRGRKGGSAAAAAQRACARARTLSRAPRTHRVEAQADEDQRGAALKRRRVQLRLPVVDGVQRRAVRPALLQQALRQRLELGQLLLRAGDDVGQRRQLRRLGLLRQQVRVNVPGDGHLAVGQARQQRRLAAAVAADQAVPLAPRQLNLRVLDLQGGTGHARGVRSMKVQWRRRTARRRGACAARGMHCKCPPRSATAASLTSTWPYSDSEKELILTSRDRGSDVSRPVDVRTLALAASPYTGAAVAAAISAAAPASAVSFSPDRPSAAPDAAAAAAASATFLRCAACNQNAQRRAAGGERGEERWTLAGRKRLAEKTRKSTTAAAPKNARCACAGLACGDATTYRDEFLGRHPRVLKMRKLCGEFAAAADSSLAVGG